MHYSLCHYRKGDKRHLQQIFPSHSLDVLEGYWCGTEETGSFILLFSLSLESWFLSVDGGCDHDSAPAADSNYGYDDDGVDDNDSAADYFSDDGGDDADNRELKQRRRRRQRERQ